MPIYEFRCTDCRKRSSLFTRTISDEVSATCEHCGSPRTSRLFSRVAVLRGDGGTNGFDESSLGDVDENDPRSMAKWIRKMNSDMGESMDPETESELERMEAGEMPDGFNSDPDDEFADVD